MRGGHERRPQAVNLWLIAMARYIMLLTAMSHDKWQLIHDVTDDRCLKNQLARSRYISIRDKVKLGPWTVWAWPCRREPAGEAWSQNHYRRWGAIHKSTDENVEGYRRCYNSGTKWLEIVHTGWLLHLEITLAQNWWEENQRAVESWDIVNQGNGYFTTLCGWNESRRLETPCEEEDKIVGNLLCFCLALADNRRRGLGRELLEGLEN